MSSNISNLPGFEKEENDEWEVINTSSMKWPCTDSVIESKINNLSLNDSNDEANETELDQNDEQQEDKNGLINEQLVDLKKKNLDLSTEVAYLKEKLKFKQAENEDLKKRFELKVYNSSKYDYESYFIVGEFEAFSKTIDELFLITLICVDGRKWYFVFKNNEENNTKCVTFLLYSYFYPEYEVYPTLIIVDQEDKRKSKEIFFSKCPDPSSDSEPFLFFISEKLSDVKANFLKDNEIHIELKLKLRKYLN